MWFHSFVSVVHLFSVSLISALHILLRAAFFGVSSLCGCSQTEAAQECQPGRCVMELVQGRLCTGGERALTDTPGPGSGAQAGRGFPSGWSSLLLCWEELVHSPGEVGQAPGMQADEASQA